MGAGCGRRAVLAYSNSRKYFKHLLWIAAAAVTAREAVELHVDLGRRLWTSCLNFATAQPQSTLKMSEEDLWRGLSRVPAIWPLLASPAEWGDL